MNAAKAAGMERVAFVAGPFIDNSRAPRKDTKNRAASLRYFVYQALQGEGWLVTLGEYKKLTAASDPLLGSQNNAALSEIKHARSKSTDLVVMLPSSPGSFLELGAFASIEQICQKMVIIVDAQYERHENYMNLGPMKQAKDNGAKVSYQDYSDHHACFSVVREFGALRLEKRAAREVTQD